LRAEGKSVWPRTVDIKAILHEDQRNETPEHVVSVANRIAALLRKQLSTNLIDEAGGEYDFDLVDTIEMMEDCSLESLAEDLKNGVTAVDMLNGWLETIYDRADVHRIWLGL
jgi:hypothetical protein